jgi:hypothetical protein
MFSLLSCYRQPQLRGVQPHEPPELGDALELDDALEPLPPLCAAKTENCTAWRRLPHCGHSTFEPFDITMRSWRAWQSSQTYSYIGIVQSSSGISLHTSGARFERFRGGGSHFFVRDPFIGENGVKIGIAPFAFLNHILLECAFAAHPQLLHHPV